MTLSGCFAPQILIVQVRGSCISSCAVLCCAFELNYVW